MPETKEQAVKYYLFTGRRVDILDGGSLKLQYNRNRYYDQYTGRWLTHDSLGYVDGMNLYEYVVSRPVSRIDPFGDVSLPDCQTIVSNIHLDPPLKEFYDRARAKKNLFGACLKKMECKCPCKSGTLLGLYDPFKRSITLCALNNSDETQLRETIKHELIHAISVCGDCWPMSCKACMEEEIRAYYWSGTCKTLTPRGCAESAWDSCRNGPLSPCGWAKKNGWKKHIPSGKNWPPDKVDGLPSSGPEPPPQCPIKPPTVIKGFLFTPPQSHEPTSWLTN